MELSPFKICFFITLFLNMVSSREILKRCDLARELYHKHKMKFSQLATWVCIAFNESKYNTAAVGSSNKDGTLDYGIFQINQKYCSSNRSCGTSCSKLVDRNIEDDFICARKIQKKKGFEAWKSYKDHCTGLKTLKYAMACF